MEIVSRILFPLLTVGLRPNSRCQDFYCVAADGAWIKIHKLSDFRRSHLEKEERVSLQSPEEPVAPSLGLPLTTE